MRAPDQQKDRSSQGRGQIASNLEPEPHAHEAQSPSKLMCLHARPNLRHGEKNRGFRDQLGLGFELVEFGRRQ